MTAEPSVVPSSAWPTAPFWAVIHSRDEFGGELPLLSLSAQHGVRERVEGEGRAASEDTSGYRVVRPGDLVINRLSARDGAYAVSTLHGLVSPAYWVLRASPDLDSRWADYVLHAAPYVAELQRISKFMPPAQFDLPWDQFRRVQVPVPSLTEQRTIAHFLDSETARIDGLIAKKRRMIDLLHERFAEQVRQQVLRGTRCRNPLQVSDADELASNVTAMKLSWLARFGGGTTPEAANDRYYGGRTPWVLTGDLNDGELRSTTRTVTAEALRDYPALRVHPAGSLVVAMYGATIGKLAVLGVDATVNQACCVIAPGRDLETGFLFFYLLGFRQELIDLGRGSGQPNISQETLRSLRLAAPPLAVQRATASELSSKRSQVLKATDLLGRQIVLLQEHRQALITAAVTGELEVPGVAA